MKVGYHNMETHLKNISKINAKKIFDSLDEKTLINYNEYVEKSEISRDLTAIFEKVQEQIGSINNNSYKFDLNFGIEMYELLFNKYKVRERHASNMQLWYALQLKEVPHIVYARWGLKEERFLQNTRRVYLWTLWWYIHISWQGNKEKTFQVLEKNNTDTLVQLVERIGRNGYRIELYRKIMYYHHQHRKDGENRNLIRKVMKLNTIRCKIIEPELHDGGIDQYASDLFSYFN
ncbi:hypothetical protein [Oceanobacillus iheyensis HTE831]|uniref:Uncharacterized protein n=2 Tax=Oceanobacillus iheyensis TaxID=182710 RepID=Q8EL94_OCEIH|nr:hypothetical protein [Oceanobacillus iheyensis HTE831]